MGERETSVVHRLAEGIREMLCQQRVRQRLETPRGRWFQIVACLDALEDSELAIAAYFDADETDKGALYLATYGVFQAFIIQQDAAQVLAQCLGLKKVNRKKYRELGEIRFLRNRIAGHPTRTNAGYRNLEAILDEIGAEPEDVARIVALAEAYQPTLPEEFHAVCRLTLSVGQCDVLTSGHDQSDQYQTIDVRHLAERQQEAMTKMLTAIVERFKRRDAEHLAAFADVLFRDMLRDLDAALDATKCHQRTHNAPPDWGQLGSLAEKLANASSAMRDELDKRERRLDDIPLVNGALAEESRGIAQVLADGAKPLPEIFGYAFVEYAEWATVELRGLADELDKEYHADSELAPVDDELAETEWTEAARRREEAAREVLARISSVPDKPRAEPASTAERNEEDHVARFSSSRVRLMSQLRRILGDSFPDDLLFPECSRVVADIIRACRPWTLGGPFAYSPSAAPWAQLRDRLVTFSEKMAARGLASTIYSNALEAACEALQALADLTSDRRQGSQAAVVFGPYLRNRAAILEEEVGALEDRALSAEDGDHGANMPPAPGGDA
ncbi:hypothetical protein [Paraliomyxa miuraensis]|uniref:hypothetical protein n=1 Tax=Paraliomyxa miuraensis TaxID=376150 RepID=UPI00224F3C13|nr:hypothetical protein [Paraliomyxa miuraensis]MCX4239094.1 hypothetical protein [Paraliomyxa miuraensis]